MPWVKRNGEGLVRAVASSRIGGFQEWLDDNDPVVLEYEAYLESEENPTPEVKAERILSAPKDRVLFKALFKQENRLRALEGALPLTEAEYVDIAKASYFEEIL